MKRETRALLKYWDFCAKNVNEPCDFLNSLAWHMYEFEIILILVSIIFFMMALLGLVV